VAKFFRKIDVSRFCISKQNFFETGRIFRSAEPNKSAALSFVVEAFVAANSRKGDLQIAPGGLETAAPC
jgi:hypothetical protein